MSDNEKKAESIVDDLLAAPAGESAAGFGALPAIPAFLLPLIRKLLAALVAALLENNDIVPKGSKSPKVP